PIGADGRRLRLSDRAVLLSQAAFGSGCRGNEPVQPQGATVMGRDQGPFKLDNPWSRIGWWSAAAVVGVSFFLGFVVLGRYQENGPTLDTWSAICRAIGLTADSGPADEPQPPLRTPTRIAWTSATLARVSSGREQNGAFVALNCVACHGERGVSPTTLIPTLAGMDAAVIYKQLDDYRSSKRLWGVMGAIATALS